MWKCKICKTKNDGAFPCEKCGYDPSCDYESYPSLSSAIPSGVKPNSHLKKEFQKKSSNDGTADSRRQTASGESGGKLRKTDRLGKWEAAGVTLRNGSNGSRGHNNIAYAMICMGVVTVLAITFGILAILGVFNKRTNSEQDAIRSTPAPALHSGNQDNTPTAEITLTPTYAPTSTPSPTPTPRPTPTPSPTPKPAPTPTPSPTPKPKPTPTPTPDPIAKLRKAQIGDYVTFGVYEQDNIISNGKEEIEWLILDKDGDKLLVTSKYALDNSVYHAPRRDDITWETCYIRSWLNDTFYNTAFNNDEQKCIVNSDISSFRYAFPDGIITNTKDKVFLLSADEAEKYFESKEARKCIPTVFAVARGVYSYNNYWGSDGTYTCEWWVRSTIYYTAYGCSAHKVEHDGSIYNYENDYGVFADSFGMGIRPAMWIDPYA